MTTQATPNLTERVSRLEGAYEQVNERLRDLATSSQVRRSEMRPEPGSLRAEMGALHSELRSLRTTIIVMGSGYCATTVGGFIALLVTD